jgi:hypothetical protein
MIANLQKQKNKKKGVEELFFSSLICIELHIKQGALSYFERGSFFYEFENFPIL